MYFYSLNIVNMAWHPNHSHSNEAWNCSEAAYIYGGSTVIYVQESGIVESPLRLVISSLVFMVNFLVVIALIKSWSHLKQNLYIFALSISVCDALLGLAHLLIGVFGTVLIKPSDGLKAIIHMGPSSWFYTVRGAALFMSEVASIGYAALIAVAYERSLASRAPSRDHETSKEISTRTKNPRSNSNGTSQQWSRSTSYKLTLAIFLISLVVGVVPLVFNCGHECACYIESGRLGDDDEAFKCFERNGCSYLFPPLMNISNVISVVIFFIFISVMTGACIKVMMAAGGLSALLPFKLHQKHLKNKKQKANISRQQITHRRLRSHSVQMSYMRNMMHFMFALTFSYIFLRLPGNVLLLVESVTSGRLRLSVKYAQAIVIIGISNSLLTPIIFATKLHGMRDALKRLVNPCCVQVVDVKIGQQHQQRAVEDNGHINEATV